MVRYSQVSVQGLENLHARYQDLYKQGNASLGELNRIKIQLRTAQLGLADAKAAYRKAKLDLGSLMNLTREEVDKMELRGTIYDKLPPPPAVEELRRIALDSRPDIVSYRLGVLRRGRCPAGPRQSLLQPLRAVSTLYLPGQFALRDEKRGVVCPGRDGPLAGLQPQPGGVQRAVLNVTQTQIELSDTERRALVDMEKAVQEYEVSRREVDELSRDVIPAAKQVRDEAFRLLKAGEKASSNTSPPSKSSTRSPSSISTRRSATAAAW